MSLNPEFVENPETRCPVVLLLDTSHSMKLGINQLNTGVATFKEELERDDTASVRVEVAIITFNSKVEKVQNFVTIDQFQPPTLEARGATEMGRAIEMALDEVEDRKVIYREHGITYYQPWVFLITDGAPTDDWKNAARRVKEAVEARKLCFYAVGVRGADMECLRCIAHHDNRPEMLDGLKFRELFCWLSASCLFEQGGLAETKID